MNKPNPELAKTFRTKQSGGLIHVRILAIQAIFILVYLILIIVSTGANSTTNIGSLSVVAFDILVIFIGVVVQLIFTVIMFLKWQKTEFRITEKELEITTGLFVTDTKSVELPTITSSQVHQGIIGKHYSYGTIRLKVGFDPDPVVLDGVPFPDQFVDILQHRIVEHIEDDKV